MIAAPKARSAINPKSKRCPRCIRSPTLNLTFESVKSPEQWAHTFRHDHLHPHPADTPMKTARGLARAAGNLVLEHYNEATVVRSKGSGGCWTGRKRMEVRGEN